MSRFLVPIVGFGALSVLSFTLIVAVIVRPWAGTDTSWRTHLNLNNAPYTDYTRTPQTLISLEGQPLQTWRLNPKVTSPTEDIEGRQLFVAFGCTSCHGLNGRGGVVGTDLGDVSAAKVLRVIRRGPEGMPAFHTQDLTDGQMDLIVRYLGQVQLAAALTPTEETTPEASATPTSTPGPAPTATTPAAGAPTSSPTPTPPTPTPPAGSTPPPTPSTPSGPISLQALAATITVDGKTADWAAIPGTRVTLQQIKPIPGLKMGKLPPVVATLKVAVDSQRVYLLVEVPDDYDWTLTDSYLSAQIAVMLRIDEPAKPHMGTTEEDQKTSLGMVDIWHWTPLCGPGIVSGGGGVKGGKDAKCGLDDEWATTPKERKDDNTIQAENGLAGVWEHTGRAQGPGTPGTWAFELSRPLSTGDPQDAQLARGGRAYLALAYWDPDENPDGWTEVGHLQSASAHGWIEVVLPQS